jgi:hypothetical protein
MQLLEAPYTPPSVFISYARPHSSAFGLLVVARLQQVGLNNPYIDMDIDPGDKWREDIEEKISGCQYFALLISPASRKEINDGVIVELATLERPNVQHEVRLARETAATIVPIWHNGFVSEKDYPDEFQWLAELNAIRVVEENPEQYQSAVDKLRNLMGYAPR